MRGMRKGWERYHSRVLCFWMCSRAASAGVNAPEVGGTEPEHLGGPQFNYEPFNSNSVIYAFGAGITAGAGTRLVLQLLLDVGWV